VQDRDAFDSDPVCSTRFKTDRQMIIFQIFAENTLLSVITLLLGVAILFAGVMLFCLGFMSGWCDRKLGLK